MIDFKPKRKLVIRNDGPVSRVLGHRVLRFAVAGFFALITTVLLFIFMDYLLGNLGKYSTDATEKLFAAPLHIVKLDKKTIQKMEQANKNGFDQSKQTTQPEQAKQPEPTAKPKDTETPAEKLRRRRKEIEALLEKQVATDKDSGKDSNTAAPE